MIRVSDSRPGRNGQIGLYLHFFRHEAAFPAQKPPKSAIPARQPRIGDDKLCIISHTVHVRRWRESGGKAGAAGGMPEMRHDMSWFVMDRLFLRPVRRSDRTPKPQTPPVIPTERSEWRNLDSFPTTGTRKPATGFLHYAAPSAPLRAGPPGGSGRNDGLGLRAAGMTIPGCVMKCHVLSWPGPAAGPICASLMFI